MSLVSVEQLDPIGLEMIANQLKMLAEDIRQGRASVLSGGVTLYTDSMLSSIERITQQPDYPAYKLTLQADLVCEVSFTEDERKN